LVSGTKLIVLKPFFVHIPFAADIHRIFLILVGRNAVRIDAVRICEKGVSGGIRLNILPAGFLPPARHQVQIFVRSLGRAAAYFGLIVLSVDFVYRV